MIGRDPELDRLKSLLTMGQGAVITSKGAVLQGEGGHGKTTLASHYARQTGTRYQGGCWVNAETREGRAQMFADIVAFGASAFGFAIPDPITEAHAKAVINDVGASGAKLLFVYDNVDDLRTLRPFLPTGDGIDILITTRDTGPVQGFNTFELDVLPHDGPDSPAVDLLLQEAGNRMEADPARRAAASALAHDLGGVPLALVIAGALVRRGEDFDDLRQNIARLIDQEPARGEAYRDSLSAALKLSYDRLPKQAKGVADTIAWWAAEGLEPRLFTDAPGGDWWENHASDVPKAWHGFLADPTQVRAAFAELRDLSLLRADNALAPHRMHRLTAAILRHRQGDKALSHARAAAALLSAVYPGGAKSPGNPAFWPACRRLTPHGLALWQKAEPLWDAAWGRLGWAAMDALLNQIGIFLHSQEDVTGDIAVSRSSLLLKEAQYGENSRDVPLALGNLGLTLAQAGEFAEAAELLDRALRLDARDRPGSADHAGKLRQRARLEFWRREAGPRADTPGDLDAALAWLVQARDIEEALAQDDASEDLAVTWNDIGFLHRLAGRPVEAASGSEQAYRIMAALPQPNRAALAAFATNAGSIRLTAGQPEAAEVLLRAAHEIHQDIYAQTPDHSSRRNAASWLVSCLLVLDRKAGGTARQAEAQAIADAVGLDWAERLRMAAEYPTDPP